MHSFLNSLPILMPIIYAWVEEQERLILETGHPLTECQRSDAQQAGVACPEKIRVVRVAAIPHPDHDDVMFIARQVGLFSERSPSLAAGYGIYLLNSIENERHALVHECVHVSQYEKKNGIRPFLDQYLRECIDPGYPFGRLEQQAIIITKDICKTGVDEKAVEETLS